LYASTDLGEVVQNETSTRTFEGREFGRVMSAWKRPLWCLPRCKSECKPCMCKYLWI